MDYQKVYLDLKAMEARIIRALHTGKVAAADGLAFLAEIVCQQLEVLNGYYLAL